MGHPALAEAFTANETRAQWHDKALWFVRQKRDRMASSVPEWEELRETASAIKKHTQSLLADYLQEFEKNAIANGAVVHWAADAEEHNRIVLSILQQNSVQRLVKSKSMLTEECHLNPWLEQHGIQVVDTDLGERIVQLREEPPSHIVLPAIHIRKEEVGECFHEHLGTEKGASDPAYLTEAARQHLRDCFVKAEAGLTGVNFAVAETGGIVICTNEGNADLGVGVPAVHIACMGMEKIIPRAEDLSVFLRLLARSATGQPVTTYSSHFHGPKAGGQLHIVIVDNGRSDILQSEFRRSLDCIRCGACMNTCPVYRRSGGHSYQSTVPGPIGSILTPLQTPEKHSTLPFACSLCGSCSDVCPVRIPLHQQLFSLREHLDRKKLLESGKKMQMKLLSTVFSKPWLYQFVGKVARKALRWSPRALVYSRLTPAGIWGRSRELPDPPKKSFRELYTDRAKNHAETNQTPESAGS